MRKHPQALILKRSTSMNYYNRYINFVKSRPQRVKQLNDGLEVHHIIPRSLGGDNDTSNLVVLTPREHFICHVMLVKLFPKGSKARQNMIGALMFMSRRGKYNSRMYESFRKEQAQTMSKRINQLNADPEWKRERMKRYRDPEYRLGISQRQKRESNVKHLQELAKRNTLTHSGPAFKPKHVNRPSFGKPMKELTGRRLCVRCGTNRTHSTGVKGKFRPRCHPCDVDLGKRRNPATVS